KPVVRQSARRLPSRRIPRQFLRQAAAGPAWPRNGGQRSPALCHPAAVGAPRPPRQEQSWCAGPAPPPRRHNPDGSALVQQELWWRRHGDGVGMGTVRGITPFPIGRRWLTGPTAYAVLPRPAHLGWRLAHATLSTRAAGVLPVRFTKEAVYDPQGE